MDCLDEKKFVSEIDWIDTFIMYLTKQRKNHKIIYNITK